MDIKCRAPVTQIIAMSAVHMLSDVLSNTQWNDLADVHDANTAYDMFHNNFSQIYNDCIPLITKKISLDRPYKPWIIKGIIKSIHRKSQLYKETIKTKQIIPFLSIKFIKIN